MGYYSSGLNPYKKDDFIGFKSFLCASNFIFSIVLFSAVALVVKRITFRNIDWAARLTISTYLLGNFLDFLTWI